jgi:uncharacterized protein (DUF2225 family)
MLPSLAPPGPPTGDADGSETLNSLLPLYAEEVICPLCETTFEATRVRIRAPSAIRRETDLRTVYAGLSPLHYAADVCPTCAYASSPDDWTDCDAPVREALDANRAGRLIAAGSFRFSGERSPQAGMVSMLLALRCYEVRGIDLRCRAAMLHRLAWMSREVEDREQEEMYLAVTREAYETAYREDVGLSEAAAVRVSYLLGELAFRLNDPREAIRWFERTIRSDGRRASGPAAPRTRSLDRCKRVDAAERVRKAHAR